MNLIHFKTWPPVGAFHLFSRVPIHIFLRKPMATQFSQENSCQIRINLIEMVPNLICRILCRQWHCRFPIHMRCDIRFPTKWYVRPAKAQTSLRICADWSEPLLVAWIFYDCSANDRTSLEFLSLTARISLFMSICHIFRNHMSWFICLKLLA